MNGSGAGLKRWVATCLVVTTVSTVLCYSPPGRANSGCALSASRAQAIEKAEQEIAAANGKKAESWGLLGLTVGLGIAALFAAPFTIVGTYALAAGMIASLAAWSSIHVPGVSTADLPKTPCEQKFAALPDAQRQAVIAMLDRGDTSGAMALVDSWTPPPPQLPAIEGRYVGLMNGFGGPRGASTAAFASGPSGTGNSGGQTR